MLQRDQGRDLFDLDRAWQLGKARLTPFAIDGARAMAAFTWYMEQEGTRIRAADANRILSQHLKKPAFRNDMSNLLRPGLPKFGIFEQGVLNGGSLWGFCEDEQDRAALAIVTSSS